MDRDTMVVVALIDGTRFKYFLPVDRRSFSDLFFATGYGWFHQNGWQRTKELLGRYFDKVVLTNKWYHIQRRRDHIFNHRQLPNGRYVGYGR